MAHECALCGCDCHCNGDIDDAIVSFTPANCRSCGCAEEHDDWRDDDWEGEDDEDDDYFACPLCSLCLSGGEACGEYPECRELWPDC